MEPTYKCRCGTNLIVFDGETKVKCGICGETSELPTVYWQSMKPQIGNDLAKEALPPILDEIKGWNWGAFLLGPIWGIGNGVVISLLCFVPIVGFVMRFVLGIKGNEWSWKNRQWTSIKQFKSHQRRWAIAGLIIYGPVALFILTSPLRQLIASLISANN